MTNAIPGVSQNFISPDSATTLQQPSSSENSDFMGTLKNAMDQVSSLQSESDGKVAQLLTGNGQDVHSAMIAVEKANLSFEMMVQVRNKIIQAYQQVAGIPF